MSRLVTSTRQTALAATMDLEAEVERLRSLLERQPSCLLRVGVAGTLLAVNETALRFLGARALAQVLGTSLVERIEGETGGAMWAEFATRVSGAGSGSLECEMTDLAGVRRFVIVQAATLPAHPDGEDSFLVTVRDVTTARRLQASLQEQDELRRSAQETLQEAGASIQELRARLAEVTAERDTLRATADALRGERQQLGAALTQLKRGLNTAIDATLLAQQIAGKGETP